MMQHMNISTTEIAVDIKNITKRYGNFVALRDATLDIRDNEFFTLLGPSGCGKTTLLRCIAGFEEISEGSIQLYGQDIADLPPNKRPVNMVFQQYALFPHMNVIQNVMFGLLRLGRSETEAQKRAGEVLEMVQLTGFSDRMPSQMSGGQQQRVALARALAPDPKVLLLDEPLSALDLKLRQAVRLELQQLQKETGITFIFVTHDQEEALTMSNRIAVISDGELQQVGTARQIYEAPKNKFVAGFIGEANLINVEVKQIKDEQAICILPGGKKFTCPAAEGADIGAGHLSVRPERISLKAPSKNPSKDSSKDSGASLITGIASRHIYLGTDVHVDVTLADGEIVRLRVQNSENSNIPAIGEKVGLNFEAGSARLLVD